MIGSVVWTRWASKTFDSCIKCKELPRLHGQHKLILVTADVSAWPRFRQGLGDLATAKGFVIARFVFDECQVFFTDVGYRHALKYPFMLQASFSAQVVLLSGTVPPTTIPHLRDMFMLHRPNIIHCHSSRSNIEYIIYPPAAGGDAMVTAVRNVMNNQTFCRTHPPEGLTDHDHILIFVPFVESGKELAKKLDIELYHANQEQRTNNKVQHLITPEQQAAILDRWRTGQKAALAATGALTAGLDEKRIHLVIHAGDPYNTISFGQEHAQGGCIEELHAVSVLIPFSSRPIQQNKDLAQSQLDFQGTNAMIDWLEPYRTPGNNTQWPGLCHQY